MPTDLAQTYVVKPEEPAATVPTFKDAAADITGSVGIAKAVRDMAPPAPTNEEVRAANQRADEARADYRKRQTSFEETFKPQVDDYRLAAQKYAEDAQAKIPQQPVLPAPPRRGLQPFLASTKDDPPENTIAKFLQAMSLFATMAGGGRAGARASLSALTGALEGWQAGNRYKADKDYQTWKDSTETMLRAFDDEMRGYNSLMIAERVPLEQKMRALELSAMEHKNAMLAAEFQVAEADKATAALEKRIDARQKVEQWYAGVVAAKEVADQKHEESVKRLEEMGAYHVALLSVKQQMADMQLKQQTDLMTNMKPETWTALGQQWFLSGKMPSIGTGGRGASIAFRARVLDAGVAWAKANGIDPMSAPHVQAELKAAQQGINTLSRQSAVQEASIRRFDGHVNALLALSQKVPRSEMPAINAAILRGETQFSGSPEAAAYVAQAFEVGMEFARVVLPGSAQGDASTREEARKAISAAYNHEQLDAVLKQFRQNAERNIAANRTSIEAYSDIYTRYGSPGARGPATPPGGSDLPKGAHREGNEIISDSGKYRWDGKAWQPR